MNPRRIDYGLLERMLVPADQIGAVQAQTDRGDPADADPTPSSLDIMHRERRYRRAKREWYQDQSWLAN